MPVSSPSYFPPNRANGTIVGISAGTTATGARCFLAGKSAGANTTQNDLIVIGDSSGSGGWADAAFAGSIVIGNSAFPQDAALSTDVANTPIVSIGINNFTAMLAGARLGGAVLIGSNIGKIATCGTGSVFARNTIVGSNILSNNTWPNGFGSPDNTLVGYGVATNLAVGPSQLNQCTFIGSGVGANMGSPCNPQQCIGIGTNALSGMSGAPQHNIAIGNSAGASLNSTNDNVLVGHATNIQNPPNGRNVIIGSTSSLTTGDDNTILGAFTTFAGSGSGNISIGSRAGVASVLPVNPSNRILIEVDPVSGVAGTFVYGNTLAGVFLLGGQPSTAAQRGIVDVPGAATNLLQICNGTKGAVIPANSGFLYVTAGVAHWVDSAGNDTTLGTVAGQLAASTAQVYSNNAAAAAGTLTNAPIAGNPTKWIPINDNGTIRNVPAW